MSAFHLRPVSDPSPSPAPTSPHTPPLPISQLQGGTHKPSSTSPTSSAMPRPRRPLSPTSLRDVDLTHVHDGDIPPRKFPVPPTGHDLMALFPPAAPDTFPEMRPGPTSGYFQRQERAFFAQAGKEIVRFRVEVDVPTNTTTTITNDPGTPRARESAAITSSRTWPNSAQLPPHPQRISPPQSSASPPANQNARPPRGGPAGVATSSLFPVPTHPQPSSSQSPLNLHPQHPTIGVRTPPQDSTKPESQLEEPRDDPDEAWRRPMPYAERRRAGKHTRRVIVRN